MEFQNKLWKFQTPKYYGSYKKIEQGGFTIEYAHGMEKHYRLRCLNICRSKIKDYCGMGVGMSLLFELLQALTTWGVWLKTAYYKSCHRTA